jgi:PKD repeat protein
LVGLVLGGQVNPFPTTPNAFDTSYNGYEDVFVSKINLGAISGYPEKGLLPLVVNFIDQTGLQGTTTRHWDFGDGGGSTAQYPRHIYTAIGSYTVTLITEGDYGVSTVSRPDYIQVGYLDGNISCSSTIGVPPFTTQFYGTASSVPPITSWFWNLGDGGTSDEQNPSHTYSQYGSYSVQLITSNPYGNDTEIKADYIQLVHVENLLPNIDNLPDLKLLTNTGYQDLFRIEDYNKNKKGDTHGILVNFLGLSSMAADAVSQSAYGQATVGGNTYLISNLYGTVTVGNQVKYSTYQLNKLPWIGIRVGEKSVLNLSNYCYSTAGRVIPPSFGSASALVVSDTTQLSARWIDSSNIEISTLSGFTASGWIDVIASPVTSNFGIDIDKERIYVYPNLLSVGTFTCYKDIEAYGLEKTTDKTSYPSISFLTTVNDGSGAFQSNVMCFDFTSTDQGIKMTPQFSSMVQYEANNWYVTRMKVCSPTVNNDLQSQLYHYMGLFLIMPILIFQQISILVPLPPGAGLRRPYMPQQPEPVIPSLC